MNPLKEWINLVMKCNLTRGHNSELANTIYLKVHGLYKEPIKEVSVMREVVNSWVCK